MNGWMLGGLWVAGAWGAERLSRPLLRSIPLGHRHNLLSGIGLGLALGGAVTGAWGPWMAAALGVVAGPVGLGLAVLPFLLGAREASQGWQRGRARRPDPSRPLILVADPHWNTDLVGLEAAATAHPEADWLFLGDLFDVWIGLPGMETEAQGRFLTWVDARREAGRWVGCWLGNREFALEVHAARFDLMGEGIHGCLAEEGLAFEHGDWVNPRDRGYRLFNLLIRSGVAWVAGRCLPKARARRLFSAIERNLRTTNAQYRIAFPAQAFAEAARRAPGRVLVTGHFHTEERAGKGHALPWAHGGDFMVWQGGEIRPLQP